MQTTKIGQWKGCPNAGFVRRLMLVPSIDIDYLPDPALLLAHDDVQTLPIADVAFKTDAQNITFDFEYKTCQYSLTQNSGADGHVYTINLQGAVPLLLAAVSRELEKRRGLRWVAFFQDHNRNFYVAGTPDCPLTLTYSQSIADTTSNRLSIYGRSPQAPYNTDALPSLVRYFSAAFERAFS